MPISDWDNISPIMREIVNIVPQPASILDLGCGGGLYGALCRNYLDFRFGRLAPGDWRTFIHGVEIFEKYDNPTWNCYDQVSCADFQKQDLFEYDLVLMIDSLEHLPPAVGWRLLDELVQNNRRVIVSVPNGIMPQGETFGNPHEAHLTTYRIEDFVRFKERYKILHHGLCVVLSIEGDR